MKGSMTVKLGMAIAGVLLAGTALAQGPGGGPGMGFADHRPPMERSFGGQGDHGRWWNNPKVAERLKLSDAQRKAMDDTLQAHREKLVDLHANLQKAELEMEPLMRADQPNEGAILAQIDKVAQSRAELEKANARFLLAIRSKLTPDQWKQLEAERANRDHEGWGREGRDHGNWQPGEHQHGQMPPVPGDAPNAAPPPAGPQSMMDDGAAPDGPPTPQEGAPVAQ